ncbi:unnamed protein product [Microthlaspi erraticum]|uniref:Uncharacterized protein n=1 Tax=Microthlaspi erraticum TaxID=1685480 RepID=A0A6D2KSI5_9BRAS|nr:unnamed protein product [Microthlaspi erraticum]
MKRLSYSKVNKQTEDTTEVPADSSSTGDGLNIEQPKDKDEVHKEKAKDAKKDKGKEKDSDRKVDHEKEKGKSLDVANFERLLQRLPGCVSRDLIDQLTDISGVASILFAYGCNTSNMHEGHPFYSCADVGGRVRCSGP